MGGVCSVECGQHWLCRMSVHCEAAGRSLSGMSCLRRITWGSPGPSTSPATSASEFRPTPPRPTSLPALQAPLRRGDPHGDLHRGLAPPADGVRSRLGRDRDRKVLSKAQNLSFLAILMIRCGGTGGADPHQQPRGGHTGGPQPPQDVQRVSGGGLNSHQIIFSITSCFAFNAQACQRGDRQAGAEILPRLQAVRIRGQSPVTRQFGEQQVNIILNKATLSSKFKYLLTNLF